MNKIRNIAKLIFIFVIINIAFLFIANIWCLFLYSRTNTIYQHQTSDRVAISNSGKICLYAPLDVPPYILPNLSVKLIIDGTVISMWGTQVDLDYRPYSPDILEYRGDQICTNNYLKSGIYNVEIIRITYPDNISSNLSIYVSEDGSVQAANREAQKNN